jgi:hypothetical protein
VARLKNQPPDNIAPFIACCICLNQRGERVPYSTIIKGYAVCDQHISLVSQPEFDIFMFGTGRRPV